MVIKRKSWGSALYYLRGRKATLQRYLQKFYPPQDWRIIKKFFYQNPIQGKVILSDFSKTNDAKFNTIIQVFLYGKSKIVYIIGARDSGKTATAFMIAEKVNIETGRQVYYVAPCINQKYLPSWCKQVDDVQDAPRGCFAIVDEAAIQYNARQFYNEENINMGKLLAIARHKDMFLIFLTQDTALADVNIRRLRDIIIWKVSNDYSLSERGTKNLREHKFWQKVRYMMAPRSKSECLFEYPAQKRFIHFNHDLPECWSEELSKIWKYSNFKPEKKNKKLKQIKKDIY